MSTIYPIAEIFDSLQGEGAWAGTPMTFIRLAGCNVGEYPTNINQLINLPGSATTLFNRNSGDTEKVTCRHSICTSFDGTKFMCDTDYHAAEKLTVKQMKERKMLPHICISGGEPFMHDLTDLCLGLEQDHTLHIETSGTKPIGDIQAWITCSPKKGFLEENGTKVDEWKFIYSDLTDMTKIKAFFGDFKTYGSIFLTPINDERYVDFKLARRCAEWLIKNEPTWQLNIQTHKLLEMR